VSHRPLALLSGLTLGDYLLWNWSLSGSHAVLALVAGLSLPPLALACLWLLAVNAGRLVARSTRRARAAVHAYGRRTAGYRAGTAAPGGAPVDRSPAPASSSSAPSPGKLAA
jgi:hypothetical protein